MNGITVLAFENKDFQLIMDRLGHGPPGEPVPFYEIHDFFEVEKFTTLDEVETWWEDK